MSFEDDFSLPSVRNHSVSRLSVFCDEPSSEEEGEKSQYVPMQYARGSTGNEYALTLTSAYTAGVGLNQQREQTVEKQRISKETKSTSMRGPHKVDTKSENYIWRQQHKKQNEALREQHTTRDGVEWVGHTAIKNATHGHIMALQRQRANLEQSQGLVRALPPVSGKSTSTSRGRGNERNVLTTLKKDREKRHQNIVRMHEEIVKNIHKLIRERLTDLGQRHQQSLRESDADMARLLDGMRDDALFGVTLADFHGLMRRIEEIYALRKERHGLLTRDMLEQEAYRKQLVETEMCSMVDILVDIAHMRPNDIERSLLNEVKEINVHIVRNRASYRANECQLQAKDDQSFHRHREQWEAKKRIWRDVRYQHCLKSFRTHFDSDAVQRPARRQELFSRFMTCQRDMQAQIDISIHALLKCTPPHITVKSVNRLRQDIHNAYVEHDELCDRALGLLDAYEVELSAELHDTVADLKQQLISIDSKSEREALADVDEGCSRVVDDYVAANQLLLAKVRAVHERDEQRFLASVDCLFNYFLRIADLWEAYDKTLIVENQENDEKIADRHDRYQDDNDLLEGTLAACVDELSQAPHLVALGQLWGGVEGLVGLGGEIEMNHRRWHEESTAMAEGHPEHLRGLVQRHVDAMAQLLGLITEEEQLRLDALVEAKQVARQEEAVRLAAELDAKKKKKGKSKKDDKKKKSDKRKEAAAAEAEAKAEAEAAEALRDAQGDAKGDGASQADHARETLLLPRAEGEPQLYFVVYGLQDMVNLVLEGEEVAKRCNPALMSEEERGALEEEQQLEREAAQREAEDAQQEDGRGGRDSGKKKKKSDKSSKRSSKNPKSDKKKTRSAQSDADREAVAAQERQQEADRAAEAARQNEEERLLAGELADDQVLSYDGAPCMARLMFRRSEFVGGWVPVLREACLTVMDSLGSRTVQNEAQIRDQRMEELAGGIDMALRKYRPRLARLEVDVCEVRRLQLEQNVDKYQRVEQRLEKMVSSITARLGKELRENSAVLDAFHDVTQQATQALPQGSSLAALSHINKKLKNQRMGLVEAMRAKQQFMLGLIDELDVHGRQVQQQWLDSCLEFGDTCADGVLEKAVFHPDEVRHYAGKLQAMAVRRQATVEEEKVKFTAFFGRVDQILDMTDFDKHYAFTTEELAAMQGLGQKYGAPKRFLTSALRGEMTDSAHEEALIEALLVALEEACAVTGEMGEAPPFAVDPAEGDLCTFEQLRDARKKAEEDFYDSGPALLEEKEASVGQKGARSKSRKGSKSTHKQASHEKASHVEEVDTSKEDAERAAARAKAEAEEVVLREHELGVRSGRILFLVDRLRHALLFRAKFLACCLPEAVERRAVLPVTYYCSGEAEELADSAHEGKEDEQRESSKRPSSAKRRKHKASSAKDGEAQADPHARQSYIVRVTEIEKKARRDMGMLIAAYESANAEEIALFRRAEEALEAGEEPGKGPAARGRGKGDAKSSSSAGKGKGKKSSAGDDGDAVAEVPPTVSRYLAKESTRALAKRFEMIEVFRAQVERINRALLLAPRAVFSCIVKRTLEGIRQQDREIRTVNAAELARLTALREDHWRRLKPSLAACAPGVIRALENAEAARYEDNQAFLASLQQQQVKMYMDHARVFLQRLVHATQSILRLNDSMLAPKDFPQKASEHRERLNTKDRMREFNRRKQLRANASDVQAHAEAALSMTVWPGVDMNKFAVLLGELQAEDKLARAEKGLWVKQEEVKAPAKQVGNVASPVAVVSKRQKAKQTTKKGKRTNKQGDSSAPKSEESAPANLEALSPEVTGLQISCNRSVLGSRSEAYRRAVLQFTRGLAAVLAENTQSVFEDSERRRNWSVAMEHLAQA